MQSYLLCLHFPKCVEFHNYRLQLLYNLTIYLAVVGIVFWCYWGKQWSKETSYQAAVVSMWPATNFTKATELVQIRLGQDVCNTTLGMFDHQFDKYGLDVHKGWACWPLCQNSTVHENCTLIDHMERKMDSGLFFATAVKEKQFRAPESPDMPAMRNFIVPLESASMFQFSYAYRIQNPKTSASLATLYSTYNMDGHSGNTLTIILDHQGIQRKTHQHQQEITMSLLEAFSLVGHPNLLLMPQSSLGMNYLPGAYFKFITPQISGAEILANLRCYHRNDVPRKLAIGSWHGNVCTMQFQMLPPKWTRIVHTSSFMGQHVKVTTYGINIKTSTETLMRKFDLFTFVSWLIDAFVLLGLVPTVFKYFMITCLGCLSQIYDATINERFQLSKNISSLALHVMASNNVFASLASATPGEGISPVQLTRALWGSLHEFEELDKDDVASFGLFCFANALGQDGFDEQTRVQLHHLLHGHMGFWGEQSNIQDIFLNPQYRLKQQQYLGTSEATDKIPLATAVKLFDKDRKMGRLEKFFTTSFFRRYYSLGGPSSNSKFGFSSVAFGDDGQSQHGHSEFSYTPAATLSEGSDSHTKGEDPKANLRTDVDCNQGDDTGKDSTGISAQDRERQGEFEVSVMARIAAVEAHFEQRLLELKANMESKLQLVQLTPAIPQTTSPRDFHDNGASECKQDQAIQNSVNKIYTTATRPTQVCQPQPGEKDATMTSSLEELTHQVARLSEQTWKLEAAQMTLYDMAREIDQLKRKVQQLKLLIWQPHNHPHSTATSESSYTRRQDQAAQQACLGTAPGSLAGDVPESHDMGDVDQFVENLWGALRPQALRPQQASS